MLTTITITWIIIIWILFVIQTFRIYGLQKDLRGWKAIHKEETENLAAAKYKNEKNLWEDIDAAITELTDIRNSIQNDKTNSEETKKMIPNLPYDLQTARTAATYKSVDAYYTKHEACPQCGSTKTSQTYLGCIIPNIGKNGKITNEASYKDINEAICECGWTGIVHDLRPKN